MADTTTSDTTSKKVVPWHKKVPKGSEYTELKKGKYVLACVRHWLYNETTNSVAKRYGIGPSHLADIFKSPAAKALRDELNERIGDPVGLAKDIATASALDMTMDWYMALEWAKDSKDYKAVAQMAKDLAAIGGLQADPPKKEAPTEQTIRIVFEGKSLDTESVEASYEVVEDEDDTD